MTGRHPGVTRAGSDAGAGPVLGLSLGHRTDREAEHWLREYVQPLGRPDLVACTHLTATPYPHVTISVRLPGAALPELPVTAPELREAAGHGAAEHLARRSGRAVRYPGVELLVGTLTVAELIEVSAIERVTVLGAGAPDPDTPVETRDFVRPQWLDGRLTLVTTPVAGNRIGPFEVPDPTPCCADHR
ncbi:hypothetical protein ACQEVC_17770 [Plantactinospora sp. CA-294935]|uniref:hypothetical protein n=1 Tax=Plantactinospora sp. CA-294935 TaxID=3240012 RepID=UPI003D89E833